MNWQFIAGLIMFNHEIPKFSLDWGVCQPKLDFKQAHPDFITKKQVMR